MDDKMKKLPEFNFQNILDFMVWLSEHYKGNFDNLNDPKVLWGFLGVIQEHKGNVRELIVMREELVKGKNAGDADWCMDGEVVPMDLFDQYMCEKFKA